MEFNHSLLLMVASALLVLSVIVRFVYLYIKRQTSKKHFRSKRKTLIEVNPRSGRKTVYETSSISEQKLAWLLAHNRASIGDTLKEYASIQSIDNTSPHLDTFGVRHGSRQDTALIHRVWLRIQNVYCSSLSSTGEYLKRMSARSKMVLRSTANIVAHLLQTIQKLSQIRSNNGGVNNGKEDSIRKDMPVSRDSKG